MSERPMAEKCNCPLLPTESGVNYYTAHREDCERSERPMAERDVVEVTISALKRGLRDALNGQPLPGDNEASDDWAAMSTHPALWASRGQGIDLELVAHSVLSALEKAGYKVIHHKPTYKMLEQLPLGTQGAWESAWYAAPTYSTPEQGKE